MSYFYFKISILICFIIAVSYWTTYNSSLNESFGTNKNQETIVLLGDSILKNNSYVSDGKGVDNLLEERNNGTIYSLAENHSKIVDIYSQIDKIPIELNNNSTNIFLSAGGNDILNNYADKEVSVKDTKGLNPIFNAYKKLIKSIQTKMNNSNIVLLDIYYPTNIKFSQYRPILEEWNKLISDFASTDNMQVINISNSLIEPTDFTLNIEPSETGGEKIANNILLY